MSQPHPDQDLKALETLLLVACLPHVPALGFSAPCLKAGARTLNLSSGDLELICPNGATDLAALLWQDQDQILWDPELIDTLKPLKIREKISTLLIMRLEEAAKDKEVGLRLMGHLALPHHLALYHRLVWATADRIWILAGDQALDENHYSKRAILSAILSTALMTRLTQGPEALKAQIERNIEQVMSFERLKAKWPLKPEQGFLDLAARLGVWRYGKASVSEEA